MWRKRSKNPVYNIHLLQQLWFACQDLNARFGIDPRQQESIGIFKEEVLEFIEAYNGQWKGHSITGCQATEHIADELADVIVTAMQMAMARGLEFGDIGWGILRTIDKNNVKTSQTHELDPTTRKIRRKAVAP